jgi:pimeloyl-ACP methyl ester carboxylesterase
MKIHVLTKHFASIGAVLALVGFAQAVHASEALAATQETQVSSWTGTLNAGGSKLRLEIDIVEAADGQLGGELRSLDQNNSTMELGEVSAAGASLSFSIPAIGASFTGQYNEERTVVEGTFSQGGSQLPLTLTNAAAGPESAASAPVGQLREAWIGEVQFGMQGAVMQFRIVEFDSGETAGYFDSVTEGRTGFDAIWSIDGDALSFDVPAIGLTFRGTLNEARDTAEGTWSQGGRDLPLTLTRKAAEYETGNVWENRPQRPVAPFPYDAEEVTFENTIDGVTLAGTLTLPRKPGRHPVVVLITGSGDQDRDQTIMEHKPFLVLADYLTRRGIAVLRYDDRGTASSTGDFSRATTEDFARDASSAVEFLRHHARIDLQSIGLVGHSEGGLIAPMVVGLRDDVAFSVLMAAPGVDGVTINESQTEAMMRASGAAEEDIEFAQNLNRAIVAAAMEAEPGADFSADLEPVIAAAIETLPESARDEALQNIRLGIRNSVDRLQSPWMRFFLSYDPRPALRTMESPVLAIFGSKDLQVLPDMNMPEIERALTEGGNRNFEMLELDGLNHLFQEADTGSMDEYIEIQETINPAALKAIGDWILGQVVPIT